MVEDEVKERISKMTDVEGLHVPHAPLTNGVFLQQNQFLPKIYGSMQISAGNHCHLSFLSNWSSFLQRSDSSSSSKSENVNDNDVNGWVQSGTTFNLYFLYYTFPLLQLQDQVFVFSKTATNCLSFVLTRPNLTVSISHFLTISDFTYLSFFKPRDWKSIPVPLSL